MLKISVINPDTNECQDLKFTSKERKHKIKDAIEIKLLDDLNAMIQQIAEKILEVIQANKVFFTQIHNRIIRKPKERDFAGVIEILENSISHETIKNNLYSAS